MGVQPIPVELPKYPYNAMHDILTVEAAAAFEWLTLTGRDKLLSEHGGSSWPNNWRTASFYPAVQYIQANRARSLAIEAFGKLFSEVDIIVTPTSGSNQVTITNQTGHPAVIVPNGLRGADAPVAPAIPGAPGGGNQGGGPNTPVSLTFLGGLYKDAQLCAFAHAYQQATGFHKLHPPLA
jgi:Asp-tRNA(Asn)/Glu-tRNA(Gln) amidotransferase A subunit family amidase